MSSVPELTREILNRVTPSGCILLAFRGSEAHGMRLPNTDPNSVDDIDLQGVYVEDMTFYTGLDFKSLGYGGYKNDVYEVQVEEFDIVNTELRKFFALLLKGNPNALTLLFLNHEHHIEVNDLWFDVLDNKELFYSKNSFYSFKGYADEQERKMFSGEKHGRMGDRRVKMMDKYGYDPKNAAHLIRLLRMGVSYLKHAHMAVDRSRIDSKELLEIKRGEWPLDEVKAEIERWRRGLDIAFERSILPEKANFSEASELCSEIIRSYYREVRSAG